MSRLRVAALGAAVVLVACAAFAPMQPPAPVLAVWLADTAHLVRLGISDAAAVSLESLATVTRTTRREQAACVTHFGAVPTARGGWLVAIIAIGPAPGFAKSDSVTVYGFGDLCTPGVPVVHSHFLRNAVLDRPSEFDLEKLRIRREYGVGEPFDVLVSVGSTAPSKIVIYGLR